ncbi:XrtA system polysaccharide chain length determinant [Aurantiacibacter gangjinensis]|uniref:Chain-length determining protein n=1 Tax=Aurantiacibacter gangjinensis TaxID=502682 RepID=A0A0G9MUK9_9SPHN|nr:XrtA system polysaccharide chain length determinant [Aurantiacibacter gangjinensis]APE28873.1 Lipopolysaccharide biosynthesis chain length determinant protein [Aurantiacibacter gangjinensis]KLE33008.1 chain-length determining protein [Aurantiacibacter gangjinensis]
MNQLLEEIRAGVWAVWNRRWLALGVAWATCLLGWLVVALIPNSYQSETRIFVQLDDVLSEQLGIGAGSRARDIDRIRQTLVSFDNLQSIVRSTRIGDTVSTPTDMEAAVERLSEDIAVVSEGENIFEITATSARGDLSDGENAELAQTIAQRMIDIFREENLGGAREEMQGSIEFLNQQLADREGELATAEERRLAFEAEYPELIGGAQAIASQLAATRSELRSVEADLAAAQNALAGLDGQIQSTPRTIIVPGAGGNPRASLAQAEANLSAMRARGLTSEHPDVVAAQRTVAALREQVQAGGGAEMGGQPNPAYTSLQSMRLERQSNVQSLQSRAAALRSEIASITASQAQEPGVAAEAQRISRDYEVLREQYDELLQDREQLRLRGQLENENSAIQFEVIDPPATPRLPAAPNRPILLFGVLLLGLGTGAGVAFALSKLGSTYATASQLERNFGLPVIGTISHTFTEAGRELRAKRLKYFAAGVGGLGVMFVILMGVEIFQRTSVA